MSDTYFIVQNHSTDVVLDMYNFLNRIDHPSDRPRDPYSLMDKNVKHTYKTIKDVSKTLETKQQKT
jgi:hypothetical protein